MKIDCYFRFIKEFAIHASKYGKTNNIKIIMKYPKGVNTCLTPKYTSNPQTLSLNAGGLGIIVCTLQGKILISVFLKKKNDKTIKTINKPIVHFVGLKKVFQSIFIN